LRTKDALICRTQWADGQIPGSVKRRPKTGKLGMLE
jgi:hypothetical protein